MLQGVHIVTLNKKAFSGVQTLYDQIVAASHESGVKLLHAGHIAGNVVVGLSAKGEG